MEAGTRILEQNTSAPSCVSTDQGPALLGYFLRRTNLDFLNLDETQSIKFGRARDGLKR